MGILIFTPSRDVDRSISRRKRSKRRMIVRICLLMMIFSKKVGLSGRFQNTPLFTVFIFCVFTCLLVCFRLLSVLQNQFSCMAPSLAKTIQFALNLQRVAHVIQSFLHTLNAKTLSYPRCSHQWLCPLWSAKDADIGTLSTGGNFW